MKDKSAVLIIDDDPVLLEMAGEILHKDYEVSCVKSGNEAIEFLGGDYIPDIILLDIDMPDLDGFETLEKLKGIEDVCDVPVVFLTGINQTVSELRGLSSGAVDYITKPFIKEILLARLKVHLDNGRRIRELSILEKNNTGKRLNQEKFDAATFDLTDTEKKIAQLIILGYTNQEIGETLFYSYGYVKKLTSIIYEKKHVSKRSELKKLFF